ncbi:MAG: mercuric reductase [Vicinamibacterales bacterium]|nr:mercuric reductase [Vicinamibacterales bacterium]
MPPADAAGRPARLMELDPTATFNADLLSQVRPENWTNPTPADHYHLVVVGAGTAGLIAASFAAGAGARVALVERNMMGGDCLNVGCVPSKSIIRSSRVFAELRDAAALGWRVPPGAEADFGAVMERMRRIRARISPHDSAARYRDEKGIDVFLGLARFTGESTLDVDGTSLRFKKAVIATGARAAQLPIPGLAECGALTNETIFNLTHRPRRLTVVGAGPIGAELAQAFCRLGCEVTLLEVMDHILGREDPDAAAMVQAALARDGVRLRLACQIERIDREGDAKVVRFAGEGTDPLVVDEVLVGVGRTPNVDHLGLDAAGVNYDARGVTVDDALQTSNPRIYAAGDVCMAWKFTHAAEDAARIAVQNALFPGRRRLSTLTMPWCTYTDPEIAHVGLYEHQAASQGVAVTTYTQRWGDVDRAITDGDDDGFVKIHTRTGSDEILGATIVARHAGEMISEVTLAMVGRLGLGTLANVIHPYPTQSDAVRRAAFQYSVTRVTPLVKRLLALWLKLTG